VRRVYPRGTRRLVTCHARCHGGARICQRTYERNALQAGAWYHGQIIRICRQKYDDSRPTAGVMGGSLQQPPAAMLEISRRHSVMLHGSCIPSFEIESLREGDDELSRPEGPVASLPARIAFGSLIRKKTEGEIFACFQPLRLWYWVVAKKTDSRSDFRLTRSRHPSASGRRIGRPPGAGWAARRDPKKPPQ
jgi:hypothetical protein